MWKTVPGTDVSLQVRNDDAGAIMLAYAADYHAFIEPLRDADSACYTPTNSVPTSNHLNATAMDLNWNSHPFQVADAGFDAAKIARMRDLLAFYTGVMFWANDWDSPKDAMHHQMDYGSYGNPATAAFVRTRIRPDGFSTYKRGSTPIGGGTPVVDVGNTTPATAEDAVTVLYDAVPIIDEAQAADLLGPLRAGLIAAECTNPKRIAQYLAQCGWESDGFTTTTEYASGAAYEGRGDLGNTQQGDGVRFKGRGWIMLTGRGHYTTFGRWAAAQGLVTDPNYFVNNPNALAELRWAGIVSAWYWTVARPQINSLCDAGDLVGVTRAINGGTNGLEDPKPGVPGRRSRYNQAIALGDRLLLLINSAPATDQGDDFMSALTPDEQREVLSGIRWLREQFGPSIWGPSSSLGTTVVDGETVELTFRDGVAEEKRTVEQLRELLSKPGVAIVTLQAPAASK